MITWLIKSTNEYRVDTMEEVEDFHKKLQDKARDEGYTLASFSWTKKEVKSGGEVVDEYYICKIANAFNEPKEPDKPFTSVVFPKISEDMWANMEQDDAENW